jgi:hypothetical protein
MRARKRWLLDGALLLAGLIALAYAALYFLVQSSRFQQSLQAEVARRTGYEIRTSDLRLVFPFRFVASTVVLSQSGRPMLRAERVNATLTLFDLFSGTLTRLELQKPTLHLDMSELFQAPSQSSMAMAVRHLKIHNGTVVLSMGEGSDLHFGSVTMTAENLNLGQRGSLTLHTELPWLEGRAQILFRSQEDKKIVLVRLEQSPFDNIARALKPKSGNPAALEAEINLHHQDRQALKVSAAGKLSGLRLNHKAFSGHFDVHATVDSNFKTANFDGNAVAASPVKMGFPFDSLKGPVTASIAGSYSILQKSMTVAALHVDSPAGVADGSGTIQFEPQAKITKARLRLRRISSVLLKPLLPVRLRRWNYDGTAEADLELQGPWAALAVTGRAQGAAMRIKSENFSLSQLSFQARLAWTEGAMRVPDLRVSANHLALHQENRELSAREMRLEGDIERKSGQPLRASGKLEVSGGSFATSDGSKVGENLRLDARLTATVGGHADIASTGTLKILEGEILWGKFFGNLKTRRPALDFDGNYLAADGLLQMRRIHLSLDRIGALNLSGRVTGLPQAPAIHAELESKEIELAGVFDFFVRPTLNRTYPIMDDLVPSGRLAFSLETNGAPGKLSAKGNIQLRGAHVQTKSNRWRIGPVDLTLPFGIHLSEAFDAASSNPPIGRLSIESARVGDESIPRLATSLSLWNNTLRLHQPLRVPVYGGGVEISALLWKDLLNDPRTASFSIQVNNLQLKRLTGALGWYRFTGSLSGSFPRIEWSGGSLSSPGQIQVDLFGGRLEISKLEIENLFSPVPSIKLDARLRDLQLEQISEVFEFGRISGILEGAIHNLVITAGQPSEFTADIHTVKRPGSSQWINVEALNKLTVLSSGHQASSVFGGLAVFFENFRYDKMGFKASLRNDHLTLRGVESKNGQEYLVVGSILPPTVNVISHTERIAFSELVRRLERIKTSAKPQIQ